MRVITVCSSCTGIKLKPSALAWSLDAQVASRLTAVIFAAVRIIEHEIRAAFRAFQETDEQTLAPARGCAGDSVVLLRLRTESQSCSSRPASVVTTPSGVINRI